MRPSLHRHRERRRGEPPPGSRYESGTDKRGEEGGEKEEQISVIQGQMERGVFYEGPDLDNPKS